jgi:hypothetical protein
MHFRFRALLGILLVLAFCLSGGGEYPSGQSSQIYDVQNQLVKAFVLVQQADVGGASPGQISGLANNLNLALQYQENSSQLFAKNLTASDFYANKSASLSRTTAAEALGLANTAREQAAFYQAVAYSIAVAAGFASALLVTESHRIGELARRRRLRRMKLD